MNNQPPENPGEQPRPTPNYTRIMALRPSDRAKEINGDPGSGKPPMSDEQLNTLADEMLTLGDAVDPDLEQLVHNRMAERIEDALRRRATDAASVRMRALAERMRLRVRVGSPLAQTLDRLRPGVNPGEEARESVDTQIFVSAADGLLLLHGDLAERRGLDARTRNHKEAVQFVLSRFRTVKIGELAAIDSAQHPRAVALTREAGLQADQINALLFVADVARARRADLQSTLGRRNPPQNADEMSLMDFVNESRQMSGFVQDFQRELEEGMRGASFWERPERVRTATKNAVKIDVARLIQGSPTLRQSLRQLGLTEEELEPFGRFYGHATLGRVTVSNVASFLPESWRNTREQQLVPKFRETITQMHDYIRNHAADYLALYCHDQGMPGGRKYAEILTGYLRSDPPRMSVKDVVELYVAIQQAEQTLHTETNVGGERRLERRPLPRDLNNVSATGGLMLQLKIVQVVGEEDPDHGNAFSGYIISESATTAAGGSTTLKLPPHVIQPLGRTMAKAGEYLATGIWNSYKSGVRGLSTTFAGSRLNPWIPEPIIRGGIHTAVAAFVVVRPLVWLTNWMSSGRRRANNTRELGRGVGREYREYVNPGPGRRAGRFFNPLAPFAVERHRKTLLDRYDAWTQALAIGPLNNTQLDAIEDMLALGPRATEFARLGALRTSGGVPAFTDDQARRVLATPAIMGSGRTAAAPARGPGSGPTTPPPTNPPPTTR